MVRIRVDTYDLKTKAKDFESAADAFNKAGDEILSFAMSLPSYEGQLSGPARAAGYEIQRQSREVQSNLSSDAQSLQKSAQAFEDVDNQTVGSLNMSRAEISAWDKLLLAIHSWITLETFKEGYGQDELPPITIELGPVVLEFTSVPWSKVKQETGSTYGSIAKGLEVLGAIIDLVEAVLAAFTFLGPADAIAFIDFLLSIGYSLLEGDTYWGKVNDDYPEMLVVGQDVWVTGSEFAIPLLAKLIGASVSGGAGVVPGGYLDAGTSVLSGLYDAGRLSELIPTVMTVGLYIEDGKLHIVFISNSEVNYPK